MQWNIDQGWQSRDFRLPCWSVCCAWLLWNRRRGSNYLWKIKFALLHQDKPANLRSDPSCEDIQVWWPDATSQFSNFGRLDLVMEFDKEDYHLPQRLVCHSATTPAIISVTMMIIIIIIIIMIKILSLFLIIVVVVNIGKVAI